MLLVGKGLLEFDLAIEDELAQLKRSFRFHV